MYHIYYFLGAFEAVFHFCLGWLNGRDCIETQKEDNDTFCITVTIAEYKNSSLQLDSVKDMIIPFLLGTVIKGW